ncbi:MULTISPECIES: NCS1 family transporter [Halomonas]|uniref:NCS1 family transporter n=1 Tax=Halomonas TaxID=2745 RepID=UPI001A8EEE28|nr:MULTISPECIES: NCS1 family transporter [Halomonas]MED5295277.1 NCS1 family transporter [Pseudomonadota bacterium]MBN8411578.1 NCS1 family transporter [Halomonas litopenaei]MBY5967394.1 NCS1 family transporter [Halomonas denitrificans]MBY5982895.1 NCS1 family transporter [Halomonas sp. DP5Y7-2]MBY6029101.1 NCS1 family transporter [Halomonas sp. DP8Y7-1]
MTTSTSRPDAPQGIAPAATKSLGDESLAPQKTRIMGRTSYLLAWFGGCVSIGTFTMGSSVVGTLNLIQATVAIAIGCFIIGIALALNGAAGYKYGIPFMVQARSAFGFQGTRLPGLVRAVPAIVWYGFQSWIGAGALNLVSATLFGYDNLIVFFIAFQFVQIGLSVLGFQGIKWLENVGSAFILASLVYMFYSTVARYGDTLSANLVTMEGSWGLPFWGATMLFLGIYSTMMLNVSDYSREHVEGSGPGLLTTLYAMSILPCTLFMGLIGFMVSEATGVADPIRVFANAVDNTPLLMTTLLFIAFAQVTTNVLNNVVPPTYVLMDTFKLSYRKASVVVGLLAFATFPWELVKDESAAGLQVFVQTYSAFLGPIFAVLVVDYYLIRRRTLDLDKLYDPNGPYRGVNLAAFIATAVGVVAAFSFSTISWYASLIPAGLTYLLLMRYWQGCQRFNQ